MHAGNLYNWLGAIGHEVRRTPNRDWHSEGFRVFQAIPTHDLTPPNPEDLSQLFEDAGAVAIRYCEAPESGAVGTPSYHVVCDAERYSLEDLSPWARKNVRRGLRNCVVEPVPVARVAAEGYPLMLDTWKRQGRRPTMTLESWQRRYAAAAALPGFGAWASLCRGEMAAFVVTFILGDTCSMIHQQCHSRFLREHVNNALAFEVTRAMRQLPGIGQVFYGMRSLDAPTAVDEFKFRMGYRAKPVVEMVQFHPRLRPLIKPYLHSLLRAMVRIAPGTHALSKACGLIGVALAGGAGQHGTGPTGPPGGD